MNRRLLVRVGIAAALLCASGCGLLFGPNPAWQQPLPAIREGPILEPGRLHRSQLANGLTLLILEDHELPRVGLAVTARRGAAIVPPASAGLAALSAELLERGAGERDALALADAVESLGASLSAASDWDFTSVGVQGLSRDIDALLAILADVVLRPRFDAAEAEKVRAELLAALERAKDEPATLARWHLARLLFPGHAYGLPLEGTPETVARLDAAAARAHQRRVFTARNAIFSAWGDLDAARLAQRVQAAFGAWEPGEVPPPAPPPPPPASERRVRVVDKPGRRQAQIALGHEGISRTDPDRLAVTLMNTALGSGGFLSRLMTRVRADEGLTYGVYSTFALRRQPGPFVVSTFTRVPEVRNVIDILLAELDGMRQQPPVGDEFRRTQTLLAGRFALSLETSAAITDALVELDVSGLPPDSLDTYRARVQTQTAEDAANAARARLHPERAAIVVVGPADEIRPQLEGLGPIEVVQP